MKQRKKSVIVIFAVLKVFVLVLVIAVFVSAGKKAYSFGYRVFAEETVSDPPGKKVAVTIEDGITISELSKLLKEKRLIRDERVFQVQYQLSEYKGKLKGGTYILNTAQTSGEMLAELSGENETESETLE
ncbi:MAG: solute-binding protein [Blautia sp.]|nr:solute-binding protein [Blautia sp.]MDY4514934.1 solute-binding protein [Lachnospiraceae bacterium]